VENGRDDVPGMRQDGRNAYEILTSSGKKLEIITNENEGKNENNPLHR
jgi:hypothetical protein